MRRIIRPFILLFSVPVFLVSCYPTFDASIDELDVAITTYDRGQDFTELESFFLYDTIVYITNPKIEPYEGDPETEEHILSLVRQNLQDYGWTEITDTTGGVDSDVTILLSVLETDINYYYNYWWDWWNWYPWDWWYGWWPGYPGYPGYPTYPVYPSYGYTIGTLFIEMINMDEVAAPAGGVENPSIKFPIVWTGSINGILAGSGTSIQNRLTKQIGQVFVQSTYLHK